MEQPQQQQQQQQQQPGGQQAGSKYWPHPNMVQQAAMGGMTPNHMHSKIHMATFPMTTPGGMKTMGGEHVQPRIGTVVLPQQQMQPHGMPGAQHPGAMMPAQNNMAQTVPHPMTQPGPQPTPGMMSSPPPQQGTNMVPHATPNTMAQPSYQPQQQPQQPSYGGMEEQPTAY